MAEVVNRGGRAAICLVCEHASSFIPPEMQGLGLSEGDLNSHAVYDLGAEALARQMSDALDAPLVLARVSRLVCDLNRPAASPAATPDRVEGIEVPGNRDLGEASRIERAKSVYHPFHTEVHRTLSRFEARPAFVTIHSFTPVWNGVPRETEIGLLHDADATLAEAMMQTIQAGYRVELNQPYSAKDGVTHTLQRHAARLPNVMIEVRNDLLRAPASVAEVARVLSIALMAALSKRAAT